ncbi:hypothetical protein [Kocuria marina]|uniref:hypothetical protein n=1 Tax=Kocuria marina TaxID=223184 RepID=UPI003F240831
MVSTPSLSTVGFPAGGSRRLRRRDKVRVAPREIGDKAHLSVIIQANYDPNGLSEEDAPQGWTRLTPQLQVSEG